VNHLGETVRSLILPLKISVGRRGIGEFGPGHSRDQRGSETDLYAESAPCGCDETSAIVGGMHAIFGNRVVFSRKWVDFGAGLWTAAPLGRWVPVREASVGQCIARVSESSVIGLNPAIRDQATPSSSAAAQAFSVAGQP
jgi:hypothetical protein